MREAAGICRSKASQQTFEIFQITRSPHLTVFQAVSLKVRPKPRPLPPVSTGLKPRRSELPVSVAHGSYFFQGNKVRSSSQFSLLFKILIRININHTEKTSILFLIMNHYKNAWMQIHRNLGHDVIFSFKLTNIKCLQGRDFQNLRDGSSSYGPRCKIAGIMIHKPMIRISKRPQIKT